MVLTVDISVFGHCNDTGLVACAVVIIPFTNSVSDGMTVYRVLLYRVIDDLAHLVILRKVRDVILSLSACDVHGDRIESLHAVGEDLELDILTLA